MTDKLNELLADFKKASAELCCGSTSCPHSSDKGGMMVNGPCRCYPYEHPMRQFVYASTRLAKYVRDNQKELTNE